MHKKLEREAAYLAGKPIRMRWWIMPFYMVLPLLLVFLFIRSIADYGFRVFIRGEIFPIILFFFSIAFLYITVVFLAKQIFRMVIIEEDGLLYRDSLKRVHKIPYAAIVSYTIIGGQSGGMGISTNEKNYFLPNSFVGFTYLCNQIRRKVGEDKEVRK